MVECWNKVDLLPGQGLAGQLQQGSRAEGQALGEASSAQDERDGSAAGNGGDGGAAGPRDAPAAGLLPAAVERLLSSDPEASQYRPAAVVASARSGQGLRELLAAVERKVSRLAGGVKGVMRYAMGWAWSSCRRTVQYATGFAHFSSGKLNRHMLMFPHWSPWPSVHHPGLA